MLVPFIHLIDNVVYLINLGLLVWLVLDMLMKLDIVNRYNPLVQRVHGTLGILFEPMLRPIRRVLFKLLPGMSGIDLSPIVLILLLRFFVELLYSLF